MTTNYAPLKRKLLEERDRVQGLMDAEQHHRQVMTETGDQERYGNHPGDEGSETFEKEKSLAMESNLQTIMDEIDEALRKFENGSYGKCEDCGRDIPSERLEARPMATLCVQCKSKVEHTAMVTHLEQARV